MLRSYFSGVRVRLLLLVLLCILPAPGLLLVTGLEQRRQAAATQEDALRLTRIATADQERLISEARQLLIALAQLPAVRQHDPYVCEMLFAKLLKQYSLYANLGVVEPNGNVFCSALPFTRPLNLADRAYFQGALQTRDFAIGDYQIGRITGVPSVNFGYPVLDEAGQVRGVVFAAVGLSWVNQLAAAAELPPGSTLTVLDRNGTILARYPDPEQWVGQTVPETPLFETIRAQQGEGTAEVPGIDGMPRLYAFTPLLSTGGEVYVSIGIPTSIAFAEAQRTLARNLTLLGLVAALALVGVWIGGDVFILRQVKALLSATQRLAAGDLSSRTGLRYGRGELSQLARAFDEMAEALEEHKAERRRAEETVTAAKARLQHLLATSPGVIYSAEPTGDYRATFVGKNVKTQLGYESREFVDDPRFWADHIHPEDKLRVFASLPRLFEQEHHTDEYRFQHKDGTYLWMRDELRLVRDAEGKPLEIVGFWVDITERKRAEEETRRRAEQLAALNEMGQTLGATLDLPTVYRAAHQHVQRLVDCPNFGISLFDPQQQTITAVFMLFEGVEMDLSQFPPLTYKPQARTGRSKAIASGQPVTVYDLPSAFRESDQAYRIGNGLEPLTALYVPMFVEAQVIGLLEVQSYRPRAYSQDDIELLGPVANQIGLAIQNAGLFDEAQRRLEFVQALREIDTAITASLDLRVTFGVILGQLTAQLGVDAADVLLLNPQTLTLEYAAGRGFRTPALQHTCLRLGEGHAGRAALERHIVNIPNLAEAEDGLKHSPLLPGEAFIAYYATPLIAKGQVKGVLEVFHRALLDPDQEWLGFLEALATEAAIAIDNASLFDDLQRSNVELSLAYDTTLEGWARALELRDWETEDHTRRVTETTLRLARAMGMSDAELVHVRRGALLHDIGKMGVPDSILLKPGPLSDEEWEIIRRHPVYAYDMLSPVRFLRPALDIPYCTTRNGMAPATRRG